MFQGVKVPHPGQGGQFLVGQAQDSQGPSGHLAVGVFHLLPGGGGEGLDPLAQDAGTPGQQHVRRPFYQDPVAAAGPGVDGGHPLAGGVEGELRHPGELGLQLVLVKALFSGGQDDGGLSGVAGAAAVPGQHCV